MKKYAVAAIILIIILFVVYEGLLYYDNNFRYGRMWETPAVKPLEETPMKMEKGVVPFTGGEALTRISLGSEIGSPLQENDPAGIEQGKALYLTYCAQCHGKDHDGNGTVGQSFHPLPTDLRSLKVLPLPEGELFQSISYGTPNGRQPPLASTIDVLDRWRIIAYLKSLGPRK
jgi:mono/diheme cytochrome c family protein